MKYLSVREFVDSGLLQECNRLFFHPRGLALAVAQGAGADPGEMLIGGLIDHRDDPTGIWFGFQAPDAGWTPAQLADSAKKAASVAALAEQLAPARVALIGHVIEPAPLLNPEE